MFLVSITAMAAFEGSSFEELCWAYRQRWADVGAGSSSGANTVAAVSHAAAVRLHAATDRWAATRATAAAAAKPDGYRLETSFTDSQVRCGARQSREVCR